MIGLHVGSSTGAREVRRVLNESVLNVNRVCTSEKRKFFSLNAEEFIVYCVCVCAIAAISRLPSSPLLSKRATVFMVRTYSLVLGKSIVSFSQYVICCVSLTVIYSHTCHLWLKFYEFNF